MKGQDRRHQAGDRGDLQRAFSELVPVFPDEDQARQGCFGYEDLQCDEYDREPEQAGLLMD